MPRVEMPAQQFALPAASEADHGVALHRASHRYRRGQRRLRLDGLAEIADRPVHRADQLGDLLRRQAVMRDIAGDNLGNQLRICALIFGIDGHSSPLFKSRRIRWQQPSKSKTTCRDKTGTTIALLKAADSGPGASAPLRRHAVLTELGQDLGASGRDVGAGPVDRANPGLLEKIRILLRDYAADSDDAVAGALPLD